MDNAAVQPIGFDRSYLQTTPARINLVLVALNAITFICVAFTFFWPFATKDYFLFLSGLGFFLTLIATMLGLFHVEDRLLTYPKWKLVVLVERGVWTAFYLSASIIAAVSALANPLIGAASVRLDNIVLYSLNFVIK